MIVGGEVARRNREQRQDVLGSESRVRLYGSHPARIQQLGELRDLRVTGEQVLTVPVQPRRADLQLHGAHGGEARERRGDLPQRFLYRRVGRWIQPAQPERGSDGAEGALEGGGVNGHVSA